MMNSTYVQDSRIHFGVYPVHPPSAVHERVTFAERLKSRDMDYVKRLEFYRSYI